MRYGLKFLRHVLTARHTKGFGIHSPYMFDFVKLVVYEKNPFYVFEPIERLRSQLLKSKKTIHFTDYGTGADREEKVSSIASRSVKSAKYSQLLYRIARSNDTQTVLELGTSLGISTAYMASASSQSYCYTLEGCDEVAKIALENFKTLKLNNIDVIQGNIDETLKSIVGQVQNFDLIFMDANHTGEATLRYFKLISEKINSRTILVVDDIYWSDSMEKAWSEIKNDARVTSTLDLFSMGIVFFNTDLNKKHYKILF